MRIIAVCLTIIDLNALNYFALINIVVEYAIIPATILHCFKQEALSERRTYSRVRGRMPFIQGAGSKLLNFPPIRCYLSLFTLKLKSRAGLSG